MSIIAEIEVKGESFELGRVLTTPKRADIELEDIVPVGDDVVPLFWLDETNPPDFVDEVESHEAVRELMVFEEVDGQTLYTLQWDATQDRLLGTINDIGGFVLRGTSQGRSWTLQIRFGDHDVLTEFTTHCDEQNIQFAVQNLYYPTRPGASPWYGLTDIQHETIKLAEESGYYAIPRETTVEELADELGVSDQAVIERLRRATSTLIDNTLHSSNSR